LEKRYLFTVVFYSKQVHARSGVAISPKFNILMTFRQMHFYIRFCFTCLSIHIILAVMDYFGQ